MNKHSRRKLHIVPQTDLKSTEHHSEMATNTTTNTTTVTRTFGNRAGGKPFSYTPNPVSGSQESCHCSDGDGSDEQPSTLRNWLNRERVPYLLIRIDVASGKKGMRGIKNGWQTWDYDRCMEINAHADPKCNAMNINLEKAGLVVVDVDDPTERDAAIEKHGAHHQTLSCRNKLPHLWRRRHEDDNNTTTVKLDGVGVDLLYKNVFEHLDSTFQNQADYNRELSTFTEFKRKEARPQPRPKVAPRNTVVSNPPETTESPDLADCTPVLDLISVEQWENRGTWRNLAWGMKSKGLPFAVFDEYSQKASNYGGTREVWDSMPGDCRVTWGTVDHEAKQGDPEGYKTLKRSAFRNKVQGSDELFGKWNDHRLAKKYIQSTDGGIKCKGGTLVVYNERTKFWQWDSKFKAIERGIMNDLPRVLGEEKTKLAGRAVTSDEEIKVQTKLLRNADDFIEDCGNSIRFTAIRKAVVPNVEETDSKFDVQKPHLFVHSCGTAHDTRTGEQKPLKKEYMITQHAGYEHKRVTDDQVDDLMKLVREVLPFEEERDCWLSTAATCMIGVMNEKFMIMSGKGRNGKGVLNGVLFAMLGDYAQLGSVAVLMKPLPTGASPEVANMHLKRAVRYTEPSDNASLDLSTVKAITGDDILSGRACYSNVTSFDNHATSILECNARPGINGRVDDAVTQRLVNINFPNRYTSDKSDPELVSGAPHVHAADIKFKSKAWQEEQKHVLFELLLRYARDHEGSPDLIAVAPKLMQYTREYLDENNTGIDWFIENYEKCGEDEDTEPIKAKDVYAHFRQGEDFTSVEQPWHVAG